MRTFLVFLLFQLGLGISRMFDRNTGYFLQSIAVYSRFSLVSWIFSERSQLISRVYFLIFNRGLELLHSVAFSFHTWYRLQLILLGFQVGFWAYHGVIMSAERTRSIPGSLVAWIFSERSAVPLIVSQGLPFIGCPYLFDRVYSCSIH